MHQISTSHCQAGYRPICGQNAVRSLCGYRASSFALTGPIDYSQTEIVSSVGKSRYTALLSMLQVSVILDGRGPYFRNNVRRIHHSSRPQLAVGFDPMFRENPPPCRSSGCSVEDPITLIPRIEIPCGWAQITTDQGVAWRGQKPWPNETAASRS